MHPHVQTYLEKQKLTGPLQTKKLSLELGKQKSKQVRTPSLYEPKVKILAFA